ncbi:ribbon-helix-helix protein, CopG family [Mycobacterium sp. M1]|uniref:Ribbon-helix-helix protein, CopG family n=1 Tax=Mycolicibacter acidiphilus TaxID=2835306 RepID=A0ABS5RIJ2_9MYCO|nr:ribbon-helix-helix protein, CopG family [Mycolicibacter acidiphilus]MBS9534123.1 ribbon-helix-helix protein, CopG family [Mycolicibacter acidiphilus]
MPKRTADDYAKMSAEVESGDYTVRGPIESGTTLRMGRPVGDSRRGASPTRTVRLAAELDARLAEYAEHTHLSPSEIMRRALDDYLRRLGA